MRKAVVLVCDGLRGDMIRPDWTPNLCRLAARSRTFSNHSTVFPSTTRTTAASIATGCRPGRHGLEGNCVALDEGNGLVAVSAGAPEFRDRLERATGRTLAVPTLSERLAGNGATAAVYSNVSAGAARFHDPDGFGYLYHRQGSFGPGRRPITGDGHLDVGHDGAGDTAMTERFVAEALVEAGPDYAVLWQCEPDHTQHACPLGSPEHVDAIRTADDNVGRVFERIEAMRRDGDDVLLLIGSDHGHETVDGIVPLGDLLVQAGLKDADESSDVVVASNGFSANLYFSGDALGRVAAVAEFVTTVDGIERVYQGGELATLGHRTGTALRLAVTTEGTDAPNEYGVPGRRLAIADPLHGDTRMGCGQHGGLGRFEQSPFLIVNGDEVASQSECGEATSTIDIAPTVLAHLGHAAEGMDGTPLPLA